MHPWFNFWFRRHIYCLLVYIVSYPTFSLFPYLSPLLVFSFENRPTAFPSWMLRKASKPGFSFLCLFCVVVHFFWWWMRAFVVLGLVFSVPSQEIGLEKRLRNDLFCVKRDVNHNSVNQNRMGFLIHEQVPVSAVAYGPARCAACAVQVWQTGQDHRSNGVSIVNLV